MTSSPSDRIIRNTAFNTAGRFWSIIVGLFLTPYIIAHVGIERYGIWAFIGVLTGYFSLLDFGMGSSFVKYISEYRARGENGSISALVSTGVVFYSSLALIVVPLAFLAMSPLLSLFGIPENLKAEASFVFRLGILLFAVSNALSAFQSVQPGLQRMDVSNSISILVSVPMIAGTVYFLNKGYGLRGLMINNAIVFLITALLNIYSAFRILPELEFSPRHFSREMLGRMLGFGVKMQFSKLADLLVFQVDRLLITYFLGVSSVGFYQVGSSIAQNLRQLPLLLVSAILPAASDMDARREDERLKQLYIRGTKYLALVSLPLVVFTVVSARLIMSVWMGPGYDSSALVIQFLAAGYLVNLLAGVGTSVSAAAGRPELQMNAAAISAVTNVALSAVLIALFGFLGAAAAATISLSAGPIYFFARLHRQLGLSNRTLLSEILLAPFSAAAVSGAVAWAMIRIAGTAMPDMGRLVQLGVFIGSGLAFSVLYLAMVLIAGCLDSYDRALVKRVFLPLQPGGWWHTC